MFLTFLAAEGEGNPVNFEIMPFLTAIVVFGLAFFALSRKVWPKILLGLDERDKKILDEIKAAEDAREKANSALREYEESLATARQEANDMIAKARDDAKATGEELRRRNEVELSEMKHRATRDIESAKQNAIAELHAEATMLATTMASKILQREITAADDEALLNDALRELGMERSQEGAEALS